MKLKLSGTPFGDFWEKICVSSTPSPSNPISADPYLIKKINLKSDQFGQNYQIGKFNLTQLNWTWPELGTAQPQLVFNTIQLKTGLNEDIQNICQIEIDWDIVWW